MSLNLFVTIPPPAPRPPRAYGITGISQLELEWLRSALVDRQNLLKKQSVVVTAEEQAFLARLQGVITYPHAAMEVTIK